MALAFPTTGMAPVVMHVSALKTLPALVAMHALRIRPAHLSQGLGAIPLLIIPAVRRRTLAGRDIWQVTALASVVARVVSLAMAPAAVA